MEISREKFRQMLIYTSELLKKNTDLLSEIDSKFGDGDHGVTVHRIAECIHKASEAWRDGNFEDFLEDLGIQIMNVNGGSAGPLWGTLFQGFGMGVKNRDILDGESVKHMIHTGITEMTTITKAHVGDKTMMDALIFAGEYADKVQEPEAEKVLAAAFHGAEAGMNATENYVAKYGRAKSYGKKTLGCPDAGAVGMMFLFKGLYEGCLQ